MKQLGYRVIGMLGPKKMRGEYHRIVWRPAAFWGVAALFLHFLWTRHRPDSAAAILCVKTLPSTSGAPLDIADSKT